MSDRVEPAIFKAYDIRGLYGEQIDASTALAIGRAFTRVIGALEDKPLPSCGWGWVATCG